MKERSLEIVLGILNIVLLVVCGGLFWGKDKNAPEILVMNGNMVYAEEAGTDDLFEGVTAFDKEDGELTDSVVIEKIVTNEAKETATITYGVADKSGNVGKATCTVDMIAEKNVIDTAEKSTGQGKGTVQESTSGDKSEEGESKEDTEADDKKIEENAETAGEESDNGSEEDTEPEDDNENEAEVESDETDAEEEDADSREEENTEERTQAARENDREVLPTAGEAGNVRQDVSSRQDPGRPSIVFKKQEVYTKAGKSPAWVNVIGGLYDDKDNYETLLKSLKINGEYDRNKVGMYEITVTVKDSDGNESNSYPMKIIVEE